jgi:hypothetical protein
MIESLAGKIAEPETERRNDKDDRAECDFFCVQPKPRFYFFDGVLHAVTIAQTPLKQSKIAVSRGSGKQKKQKP